MLGLFFSKGEPRRLVGYFKHHHTLRPLFPRISRFWIHVCCAGLLKAGTFLSSYTRSFLKLYTALAFEHHSHIPQHHHEDGNFLSAQCHNRDDAHANAKSRHLFRVPLWQRPRSSHPLLQQFRPSMSMAQTSSSRVEIASPSLVSSKQQS
jgi:hypothetical protein